MGWGAASGWNRHSLRVPPTPAVLSGAEASKRHDRRQRHRLLVRRPDGVGMRGGRRAEATYPLSLTLSPKGRGDPNLHSSRIARGRAVFLHCEAIRRRPWQSLTFRATTDRRVLENPSLAAAFRPLLLVAC
jgi:hypothetical protein